MPATKRQLAAIMFTDIAGYTSLMGSDEHRALEVLEIVRSTIKPLVVQYNGKWQKEIGDGSLSSFHSAVDAVKCALEVQKRLAGQDFKMRIGVHVGEVAFTDDDIFGDGVNIASRIEPLAPPGGIYITGRVYEDIVNKPDIHAAFVGERQLKNVNRPISIYTLYGEGLPEPPGQPATNKPGEFFSDLWHRRLPQILLIYLAASWLIIQSVRWAITEFMWSPHLTEFTSILLLTLLPSVGLIAYYHGRAGMEKWVVAERVVVPVNLLLTLLVLFFMFRSRDLGATTTEVTVEDEKGNIVQKIIPKGEYVRNIAIFDFENEQNSESVDWVSTAIQMALQFDLEQDQFIRVRGTEVFIDDLKKARIRRYDQAPFQLLLSIARTYRMDYFLMGSYRKSGSEYQIKMQLYESENGKLIGDRNLAGDQLMSLVDDITLHIKEDLGTNALKIEETEDLDISVLLTQSLPAFKAYTLGFEAARYHQDYQKSLALFHEAVEIDPNMVIAHFSLGSIYMLTNQMTKARTHMQEVMDKLYMLSEKDQYFAKSLYYYLNEDQDKRIRVLEMMRELYPRDIRSYDILQKIYNFTGQPAKAEQVLRDVLRFDDNRGNFYVSMADVLMMQGKREEAKSYYQLYADTYPSHERSFRMLGNYYYKEANYTEAEKHYEKSMLLSDGYTESMSKMALIRERQGQYDEAERMFAQAMQQAGNASDSISVMNSRIDFLLNRGRIREVIGTWNEVLESGGSVWPPISLSIMKITRIWWYFLIDQDEKALQVIRSAENSFNDSFKGLLSYGYINYFINMEDLDNAMREYEKVMEYTDRFGSPGSIEEYYGGEIALMQKDYETALARFQKFKDVNKFFQPELLDIRIANCQHELGNEEAAKELLREILRAHPYHARTHLALARLLLEENNTKEARQHLLEASEIWSQADSDYIYVAEVQNLLQDI